MNVARQVIAASWQIILYVLLDMDAAYKAQPDVTIPRRQLDAHSRK